MIKHRNVLPLLLCFILLSLVLLTSCDTTTAHDVADSKTETAEVIYRDVFDFSTEGGYLKAVLSKGEIQYLHAKIFGETFQCSYDYSYINDNIIICYAKETYNHPIYINEGPIRIESVEKEQYLFTNNTLYSFASEDNMMYEISEEKSMEIIGLMNAFVEKAGKVD